MSRSAGRPGGGSWTVVSPASVRAHKPDGNLIGGLESEGNPGVTCTLNLRPEMSEAVFPTE